MKPWQFDIYVDHLFIFLKLKWTVVFDVLIICLAALKNSESTIRKIRAHYRQLEIYPELKKKKAKGFENSVNTSLTYTSYQTYRVRILTLIVYCYCCNAYLRFLIVYLDHIRLYKLKNDELSLHKSFRYRVTGIRVH